MIGWWLAWVGATEPVVYQADQLVRVDVPNHPDAIASSSTGSLLEAPPTDGTPWRYESVPELDLYQDKELLEATNADLWLDAGVTGAGVKVAVFDVGWFAGNTDPASLGDNVTSHDCFWSQSCAVAIDTLRPRIGNESGVHGYGCAETIRQIAPDAELFLVRANSFTALENAVEWAIREEIDIISMSMSYYNLSFYDGGGAFNEILHRLEAHDVLFATSAGNDARGHWWDVWRDVDHDNRHDGDGNGLIALDLPAGPTTVYLGWNQYGECGDTDLDVVAYDERGLIVGSSSDRQEIAGDNECAPNERLVVQAQQAGLYYVEIVHRSGGLTGLKVDINTRRGDVVNYRPDRALADPASHELAYAVGAVPLSRYDEPVVEGFSAHGPNHAGVAKPDIAGPDGLTNVSYGAVGFFGTSASTPAVVGLLALIMSDDPTLSSREAADVLNAHAIGGSMEPHRPDPAYGAGKARLPVRDVMPLPCGRRPLLMFFVLWLPWWRRARD